MDRSGYRRVLPGIAVAAVAAAAPAWADAVPATVVAPLRAGAETTVAPPPASAPAAAAIPAASPATEKPIGEAVAACAMPAADEAWVQRALDGWRWVLDEALAIDPRLPWMVLFDATCTWQLGVPDGVPAAGQPVASALVFAGRPVALRSERHGGTVVLPNGKQRPPAPMAAGTPYEAADGVVPFFALAMVDVWRQAAPDLDRPALERFFSGVAIHEMVHTLQIVDLDRRIGELGERFELPEDFDDDIVQTRFEGVAGCRELFEAERDLLFRAALATDEGAARTLARHGLGLLAARREHCFGAQGELYERLEDLFLNLEGLAVWSHFQLALHDPAVAFLPEHEGAGAQELIAALQAKTKGYWTQDEGFALYLLLDRLVPDWRREVLTPELPSPVGLLARALAGDEGAPAGKS